MILGQYTKECLAKAVDFEKLFKERPDLINISKLDSNAKMSLLKSGEDLIINSILGSKLTPDDIFLIVRNLPKAFLKKHKIALTQDHIKSLGTGHYMTLLKTDLEEYFITEKWEKLPAYCRNEIFTLAPEFFFKNKLPYPKLTRNSLHALEPRLINQYLGETDIASFNTDSWFWEKMIKHKSAVYKPMFIRLMSSVSTATDIRAVFYDFPDLVKMVKVSDLENSKLSLKQWVLLFRSLVDNDRSSRKKNIFKDWQFDQQFVEDMELGLTLEMLNGKSKVTKQFQNAMSFVRSLKITDIEEDEDETETVE